MTYQFVSTSNAGVRYKEHPTRKNGKKPDKYFVIRYRRDGKTCQEGLGWASKEKITQAKAAELLAEITANIRNGSGPRSLAEKRAIDDERRQKVVRQKQQEAETKAAADLLNKTFSEVWEEYFADALKSLKSAGTCKTEKITIEKWALPALGKLALSDIKKDHLDDLVDQMREAGRAPRTIQYQMAIIRQIFSFGIDKGYFNGIAPTRKVIKAIKFDNERKRWLKRDEVESLLNALKKENSDLHDMALLSLHTGMRGGEIFKLEWKDVDLVTGCITLMDTKNTQSRFVFASGPVKAMLERRKEYVDEHPPKPPKVKPPYVFPGRFGNQIKDIPRSFEYVVEKLGLNEGITDRRQRFTFHCLRHTCASWLIQAGTPMYVVQKMLGHQTAKLTERYSHLAPANLQAAAEFFNDPPKSMGKVKKEVPKRKGRRAKVVSIKR